MRRGKCSAIVAAIISIALIMTACDNNGEVKPSNEGEINRVNPIEESNVKMIAVNQVGYSIKDPKIAVFIGKAESFYVINKATGESMFTGKIGGYKTDVSSGDEVGYGDFSQLQQPGTYYISVQGKFRSSDFIIAERPYKDVKNAMLKAFYYQRCGIALEEEYAGIWQHDICHADDGYLYDKQGVNVDTTGGWHDAGDYGKYVVPAAKAVADLMWAYEICPESFSEQINIPESGNGVPDALNEVRYELEWMLKMQDTSTGGVYHKVATLNFPGFIMPEADKDKRYINSISATATADFAAAMAMGHRVYKDIDESFADVMLEASQKAWQWLDANPDVPGFKNPQGVNSGEYGDSNDRDERFWAAVELYRSTGQQKYHDYIEANYEDASFSKTSFGWSAVGGYGTVSYLTMDKDKTNPNIYDYLTAQFMAEANRLVGIWSNDGYKVALGPNDYYWGSNGEVMNRAMCLIFANNVEPNNKYIEAARDQLSYILGRNALGQCYLTGFGAKPIMHPHHRPSEADGIEQPVPGMLSGGPNSGRQDPTAEKEIPAGTPPAKCFVDNVGSYSTNEIAIYWNSPAVFVAAYFDRQVSN
ncbi:glycoside hydrolase family 9 protein [Mahella sp.]|uniref:glycoside hydrolase family 9 protein n=1 Tax=Mahella sp. TaxID=2798721 RepID=UPI0025C4FA5A|nr:glycoside hydrolase family 9 protein [Mahella sp.]